MCAVFSYQVGDYSKKRAMLISYVPSIRVRDSGRNWEQGKFRLDIKKKVWGLFWGFFLVRIFGQDRGHREVVVTLSCSELDWTGPEQHDLTWKSFFEWGFEQNSPQKSLPVSITY